MGDVFSDPSFMWHPGNVWNPMFEAAQEGTAVQPAREPREITAVEVVAITSPVWGVLLLFVLAWLLDR